LERREVPFTVLLAEPAASIARQDGVHHLPLTARTPAERTETVLAAEPSALLLGTSVQAVVERELARRARGQVPTLAVLDAMLFVERRFGADLAEISDLTACPDLATAERLRQAGVPADRLVATGNPTLEEIGVAPTPWPSPADILFVSSPVAAMRLRGAEFAIDEREALDDALAALADLAEQVPGGFRVRVRLHPVQRDEGLPPAPSGIILEPDDDPDRLRSCAKARVVVGLSSTLLAEARFLPRAAIAYLPGPFWNQEQVFAPEYGVEIARTPQQLRTMLTQALSRPPAPAPLAGHLGAAERIADLLLSLPNRG
jgi:hypothetical protein